MFARRVVARGGAPAGGRFSGFPTARLVAGSGLPQPDCRRGAASAYSIAGPAANPISKADQMDEFGATADRHDIDRFAAQAASWWDPRGSFRPLHQINPARIDFIRGELLAHFRRDARSLSPFAGLRLADIGCGGGLIAEPMARLGFAVTGIDAAAEAVAVAREHARAGGLAIDYRAAEVESLAASGERFDAVLALEIVEHVADRDRFLAALGRLARPGGMVIGATLNRTARSFALAVVGAEYVLGWVPRGTHDWNRFVRPSEFVLGLRRAGVAATRLAGLSYDWRSGDWGITDDLSVNYMLVAIRR
jgi:2-polyprenyl-6-hydroxyphenyl methylase/3-demethylubiquinone-9 3-methyltransferase